MTNTFRNLARPGQTPRWGVQCSSGDLQPGQRVTVTSRNGSTRDVTLGAFVLFQYGCKVFEIAPEANAQPQEARQQYAIGEMNNLLALFDRASAHLRFPGIVLKVHNTEYTIRVKRAGAASAHEGTLNVTDENQIVQTRYGRGKKWFGRVHRNGQFEMARDTPLIIGERLREFAADPVRVASEHGRLTGRCCFCNKTLDDERSTAVGYGPVCAGHYGLPWGDRPAEFAAPASAVPPEPRAQEMVVQPRRRRQSRAVGHLDPMDGNY